jgi:hypothetical protein
MKIQRVLCKLQRRSAKTLNENHHHKRRSIKMPLEQEVEIGQSHTNEDLLVVAQSLSENAELHSLPSLLF